MSEDVSATMRVGITVILVAALVATVLNLMVMSNALLSGGQTTLQSGIDSVSQQEFASYDNTKVSGTQVATALSLFQGRDIAIIIQTKAFDEATGGKHAYAVNYGAILTTGANASSSTNIANCWTWSGSGVTGSGGTLPSDGSSTIMSELCKKAYIVRVANPSNGTEASAAGSYELYRQSGAAYYTAQLHNTNGLVDSCYDIINTTTLGNSAYLLSSARFSSVLIKDPTGSIIGIYFKQLN